MGLAHDPGLFIVSIRGVENIEDKKRISEISGVVGVEQNHLTQKIFVSFDGDAYTTRKIERELNIILRGRVSRRPPQA